MRNYGEMPKTIARDIHPNYGRNELMFYQYLPIKINGMLAYIYEDRLLPFEDMIDACILDFKNLNGTKEFKLSYIYLTVKRLYQEAGHNFNRGGYHSDGFMTDDINYIWSDKDPTLINLSPFKLSQDDRLSLKEMQDQAHPDLDFQAAPKDIIRLDQYHIHRTANPVESGVRTFFKLSFSKDKYDLQGNSHNYLLNYDWKMRERSCERNMPQKEK